MIALDVAYHDLMKVSYYYGHIQGFTLVITILLKIDLFELTFAMQSADYVLEKIGMQKDSKVAIVGSAVVAAASRYVRFPLL